MPRAADRRIVGDFAASRRLSSTERRGGRIGEGQGCPGRRWSNTARRQIDQSYLTDRVLHIRPALIAAAHPPTLLSRFAGPPWNRGQPPVLWFSSCLVRRAATPSGGKPIARGPRSSGKGREGRVQERKRERGKRTIIRGPRSQGEGERGDGDNTRPAGPGGKRESAGRRAQGEEDRGEGKRQRAARGAQEEGEREKGEARQHATRRAEQRRRIARSSWIQARSPAIARNPER